MRIESFHFDGCPSWTSADEAPARALTAAEVTSGGTGCRVHVLRKV